MREGTGAGMWFGVEMSFDAVVNEGYESGGDYHAEDFVRKDSGAFFGWDLHVRVWMNLLGYISNGG